MKQTVYVDERRRLARAVRAFANGRWTSRRFEAELDELAGSRDLSVQAVMDVLWNSYCDFQNHKANLSPYGRRLFARCYLFLMSNQAYSEPKSETPRWARPIQWLTLGQDPWSSRELKAQFEGPWPFRSRRSLDEGAKSWLKNRSAP